MAAMRARYTMTLMENGALRWSDRGYPLMCRRWI